MPGIVGIIGAAAVTANPTLIDEMLECMVHEKFYASGTTRREAPPAAIGWTCHRNSFSDCNPIWSRSGETCMIFSGEHYETPGEARKLASVSSNSSEYSAAGFADLYEEHGLEFLRSLNGWFSGVILNLKTNQVVLFNDRYGLGRIYYYQAKDGFYFASEAKSLLKVLPSARALDMAGFAEFFSCGCVLQNRSLFAGVSLLPGGSIWTFPADGAVNKERYFDPKLWEDQAFLDAPEYYQEMRDTFIAILPRYFRGSAPAALSLTGGLDSRMIIACMDPPPHTLPCFSFGGMYRQCADVRIAERIAQVAHQDYQVIPVNHTFFAEFPNLAERAVYYTDGNMDVTGAVDLFANRVARQISPVRMTGNYGSEILRGNVVMKPAGLSRALFDSDFADKLDNATAVYESERKATRTSFIAFKQVPWLHYARLALEQSQLTVRSPFLDNDLVAVAYRAPQIFKSKELCTRLVADCNPALARIPTDRGWHWLARSPQKLRTFCEELMPRAEYLFDYGMPQWLAKINRLLTPLGLERLFLGRQKFYHFRTWYQHQLASYVKDILLDSRSLARPYLDGRRVQQIVTAHLERKANYTLEIHKLLTAELIHRTLLRN